MCDRCSTQSDVACCIGPFSPSLSSVSQFFISLEKSTRLGNSSFGDKYKKEKRWWSISQRKSTSIEEINICACVCAKEQINIDDERNIDASDEFFTLISKRKKNHLPLSNDYDPSAVCLTLIFGRKWSFLRLLRVADQQENSINAHISYRISDASYLSLLSRWETK